MKYPLSSLMLLLTAVCLLTPATLRIVRGAQDGNPFYLRLIVVSLGLGILLLPFLFAYLGFRVSKRLSFESPIPGIAWGVFLGYLFSFGLMGIAAYWQDDISLILIPIIP